MTARWMAWYACALGALGVLPFLAVRLSDAGLSDRSATAALALLPLGTLVGGPAWAWAVDRSQRGLGALRVALLGSAAAYGILILPLPGWALVAGVAAYACFRGPVFPLADASTVARVGRGYGRIRAMGSVGYIAMVLLTGWLGDARPWLPIALGAVLLGLAAGLTVGMPAIPPVAPPSRADLRALLARPGVRELLGVTFLNGVSLSTYDHLFTLHVRRLGLGSEVSGAAVACGVAVEVGVLLAGAPLLARFGSGRLLVLACAVAVPRFALTAWTVEPAVLIGAQALHGLQFGAFWIAAVDRMSVLAPPSLRRSAQSLLPATGFGLATLASLGVASAWLGEGAPRALFGALVVPALLATAGAVRAARRDPTPTPELH